MAIGNPITLTNNIADKVVTLSATADQTLFTVTGGYLVGKLNVFRNGVKLTQSSDYTANDGTTVTLIEAANLDDTLQFQVFDYFAVADAITSQGGDISGNITVSGNVTATTFDGALKGLPQNEQTSAYILVASDTGKHISITTGGVTVPSGVFSAGDVVTIFNNSSSSQTITQGASVTLRQAATTNTGSRTLAEYGVATVMCVAANTFVISGTGVT